MGPFGETLGLIIQGGSAAVLLLWLVSLIRGDFRTKQELNQAQSEIARQEIIRKELIAAHLLEREQWEKDREVLRKEVSDWQTRSWNVLNEFAKPAVQVMKDRQTA